jgi:hypothetical protein
VRRIAGHPLDGEVSWQWEDYFRVAAAMHAAAHELEAPIPLGRLLGLATVDRVPSGRSAVPLNHHAIPAEKNLQALGLTRLAFHQSTCPKSHKEQG